MAEQREPEIAAGIIFFNDAASLKRCLPTLSGFDTVFCIDGKFDTFDYPSILSNDGSREVVKSFNNTILIDAPNLKEFQKRNRYFELCAEHHFDYLLLVDADEWIEGDFDLFKKTWIERSLKDGKHLRRLPVQDADKPSWFQYMPIVFYRPGELEYRGTHWTIARRGAKTGDWEAGTRIGFCDGIRKMHEHQLRNQDYMRRRDEFQQRQKTYEMRYNILSEEHEDDARKRIMAELTPTRLSGG